MPPTKTARTKPTENAVATTTQEDDVVTPILVRLRFRHIIVDESTEEEEEETSEDKEFTEEVPFHTSENYIKHYLYKRWINSKTEVASLAIVVKEIRREVK